MADENVVSTVESPAAATPAATPAPAASGAPATPATPATPQAPATGAAPEGWVPSYRLREAREAATRQAAEQRSAELEQLRAEADQYKRQLQALVGFTPPQNPEVQAVRDQFGQLYPGLNRLEERAQQLEELLERAEDLESQNSHYWRSYGRQTMDRLFSHASESLGGPLSDEAKRALHSSFTGFIQSSPELLERYANDPSIIEDFWKAFASSFIEPARRSASATVAARATGTPLPQDTPGGAPRATPAPQLQNMDERAAAAWALYQQNANKK